jgi:ubiquinone/menaquinone biosynthesis C-methylase UbiE
VSGQTPESPPGGPDAAEHRRRFIEHTLAQRVDEEGRALLAAEWRYIGPLLGRGEATKGGAGDVLDLACGSGHQTLAWAERGFSVTGLDFDRDLLHAGRARFARAGARTPAAWAQADATRLPFRGGSFDAVFNNSLLEHVPDWRAVLAEAARVLRPGGVFVMYTTNRACPIQQEVNGFPFYSWLPGPIQRGVLRWIMANRRDLVNFTDYPAIHWFSFGAMRRAFRAVGLEPYDRLDLLSRAGTGGLRGAVASLMALGGPLKWPYYLTAVSMALYGVRRR